MIAKTRVTNEKRVSYTFTQHEIKSLLMKHLVQNGYEVSDIDSTHVSYPSGFVANDDVEMWFIKH